MTKKLILWLGISLVCFTAFVLSVRATEKESVSLTNVDGKVEATLELPGEAAEEIVALQLSFQIKTEEGTIQREDISFDFDTGFSGTAIKEYHYQEDTGILSIYISGKEDLYSGKSLNQAQNPEIPLGKVVVNSDRTASVKVVKNSFKTVNKAHGMYEGEVNAGDGGETVNNGSTDGGANDGPEDGEEMVSPGLPNDNLNPDKGNGDQNIIYGNENFGEGSNGKRPADKEAGAAGIAGISKKVLNADRSEGIDRSDAKPGIEAGVDNFTDREQEEEGAHFSEDLLWEEGAKLWKDKIGAVDMDVWTKLFFGLFAVSASVASAIGIGLTVKASGKRKKRRKRLVKSSRSKKGMHTVQIKKSSAKRKTQKKRTYQNQPVWKDNNKPYVRKRRKIS